MIYRICPAGQYWGIGTSGCNECLDCPLVNLAPCPDGTYPQPSEPVENQCTTYSCPGKPVICPMIVRLCPQGQFWGIGASGCNECRQCPIVKLAPCADGSYPQPSALVQNKCPTYSCPP